MSDFEDSLPNSPAPAPAADEAVSPLPPDNVDTAAADDDKLSDSDSLLSEVDEAQFADLDPTAFNANPDLDFETLNKTIKVSKRKRADGDDAPRKKKEGRREKPKKSRKKRDDSDEGFSGGEEIEGKRRRKRQDPDGEAKKERRRPIQEVIPDEHLTPEERRRRALDRAMDEAIKKPTKRRVRKGEIDLEAMADAEIDNMRKRMTEAAEKDAVARRHGLPASHKLKMLPEVVALLNRNTYVQALTDPETNLLEAVRFFLEPLEDGSLPAYNIQRDLFAALAKLPISKDTLIASGIGKVIVFYTKSKRPELGIKRQAERLLAEWTRPLLQRSDDYSKKVYETAVYDPTRITSGARPKISAEERISRGAVPAERPSNRARIPASVTGYTIVPQSVAIPERYGKPTVSDERWKRIMARKKANKRQ